jgi:hypothetical protein
MAHTYQQVTQTWRREYRRRGEQSPVVFARFPYVSIKIYPHNKHMLVGVEHLQLKGLMTV